MFLLQHPKAPRNASFKPNCNGRHRKRRCKDTGPMVVKLPSATNLVMGQVKILKRGEELDPSSPSKDLQSDPLKDSSKSERCLDSADICDDGDDDLALCSTGRLGPDPDLAPKPIRLSVDAAIYAGSAFASSSPSPSSLPFPAFCKNVCSPSRGVHDGATNDLRRLLGLDVL
ncbi:hypothetical protein MRB53_013763 [Persea americana]|uniref:Uncharacterized protein n=1 Tax=Persea americana TaxID=3435 RepID=A0ACC2K8Z4_PERAE|nr:hypothetical protein MRB53_013763 [Persea americana]